jgi:hypothetical protein
MMACITDLLVKSVQRWDAKSGNTLCKTTLSLSANLTGRSPQDSPGSPRKGKKKDSGGTPDVFFDRMTALIADDKLSGETV